MIQSFADQTTADLFVERPSRAARRIPTNLWLAVRRKLKLLDVAQRLSDLASPPGNRLEALKGGQRGRYSIRVNDQYRLTFRWEGNHAYEVRCEDYHA
jgi:proteic killer suppression protein